MLQTYNRILVAIDGSEGSDRAFRKAVEVAKRNEAYLLIAHVVDTRAFQPYEAFDKSFSSTVRAEAEKTLNDCKEYANEQGVKQVETIIEFGSPKIILTKELPIDHQIDLIMVGATGLNSVERFLIGSVSESVIRKAPCDVLVVRSDMDNELADDYPKEEK